MSALSHGVKIKFLEFFKSLFRRPAESDANYDEPVLTESAPAAVQETNASPTAKSAAAHGGQQNENGLCLPLQPILESLPLELRARVRQTDVADLSVSVPLVAVLSQLASGAVKISFGQVRQAAPHVFTDGPERDQILVGLPLGEILSRLNPALLVRRPAQKWVEVPAEIISPFDANGQGLVFSVGNAKSQTPTAPRASSLASATPLAPARASIQSAPTTPPPASIPMTLVQPFQRSQTPAPIASPSAQRNPAPAPVLPPALQRGRTSMPVPPPVPEPSQTPAPPVAIPFGASAQGAKPVGEQVRLIVELTALAEGWPEALRQEIVQLSLVDAKLGLPVDLVENALKRGRVTFTWKVLRSWIKPSPLPTVSAHDSVELEMPLKVLAPLFLARQTAASKAQQKVAIDADIPNLFFGFPKPETPAARPTIGPVAKPVDTNYYVWDDTSEVAKVDETEFKRKLPSGTDFVARYATPNEIVSRAAALEGVAGALIALPDGLMVASQLSPDLNSDTLAAFLPQIFGKVSQSTKELRMGELNNLSFTVGSVPWKIFRVHSIFFAAFGRDAEPLPTAQLAALAAELDRKK